MNLRDEALFVKDFSIMKPVFFLYFLLASVSFSFAQQQEERPNFIFYLADDQDLLDYGVYGNEKVHTPALDRLAGEGMLFERCYTGQAICAPSRSQLYTGKYPFKNGCIANHIPSKPEMKSVSHYLKALGYDVILAGKSHVGPDSVYDWTHYWPAVGGREIPHDTIESYFSRSKTPFCLFVASDYPHAPYPIESEYNREEIKMLPYEDVIPAFKSGYYYNIMHDNQQLEELLQLVDKYGLRGNTVFVYASDHGKTGKFTVKDHGLRVPLIIRWPDKVPPKSVNSNYVSFVDILPTFIDMAGGQVPDDLDGKSVVNLLIGNVKELHDYLFGIATNQNIRKARVFPSRMVVSTKNNFKLICNFNSMEVYGRNLGPDTVVNTFIEIGAKSFPDIPYEELYDLEKDPYEKRNLASDVRYHFIKRKLSRKLQKWMESQGDFLANKGVMPLIPPTLHPLDKRTEWNQVPDHLLDKIDKTTYIKMHYHP